MLEKVREESWDEVFVLEATRSDLPRLFFRAYSAGGYGCDSIDNGDIMALGVLKRFGLAQTLRTMEQGKKAVKAYTS